METKELERHIIDTIKEWQIKIGYLPGDMRLYYPAQSLAGLLKPEGQETLETALAAFAEAVEPRLGKVSISHGKGKYCLDIPSGGCAYVAEHVPEPEFLKRFLKAVTAPGADLEQVRACFSRFAGEKDISFAEEEGVEEDGGRAFYFEAYDPDPYVYCVEWNEFGATYHRFTRREYEGLKGE